FNALPLTISTWFRTTTSFAPLFAKGAGGPNGYLAYIYLGTLYVAYSSPGAYTDDLGTGGLLVNDGQWHQLTVTADNFGRNLYLDGVLVSSGGWRGTPSPITNLLPLRFGSDFSGDILVGDMDEIEVWNAAL